MINNLPTELANSIGQQIKLRQAQLQRLTLLYNGSFPSPQVLIAYGPEDAAKLDTIRYVLNDQGLGNVTIFGQCVEALGLQELLEDTRFDRIDSINALVGNLKKLLTGRQKKLVLVLEGADQQRGATATLFPAIARLSDVIPCLSVILLSNSPRPLNLHKSGIPYIYFPPYRRDEAIRLLLQNPPLLSPDKTPPYMRYVPDEKLRNIYEQFATVVYDTLIAPTTNSIAKYRAMLKALWPRFIWPLVSGEKASNKHVNQDWDFALLLSRNRVLFQKIGEEALEERLISTNPQASTFDELIAEKAGKGVKGATANGNSTIAPKAGGPHNDEQAKQAPPLLNFFATLLLLSAYLASHTHNKHDIVLFSRLSTASSTNRRKKKYLARSRAGGITKTPTKSASRKDAMNDDEDDMPSGTPSKNKTPNKQVAASLQTGTPKKERADRSMRAIFEKTSNIARPFTLERLVAILRAIHPDGIKAGKGIADRIYSELGELERLRLVVRNDERGKIIAEDIMEERWRCLVGREWVVSAGKHWNLSIEGWEVE